MNGPSIVAALDDPELFRDHFKAESWRPWKTFLRAWSGEGASMTEAERRLYFECTGRNTVPTDRPAETVLICGRRAGKSRVLAAVASFLAATSDVEQHLAAGEVATVSILASDRRQARTIFRYVAGFFSEIEMLRDLVTEEQQEVLKLNNRVQIEVATASFRNTRGYTYLAVCCDEAAFWRDEAGGSVNPAGEIIRALRPGLATIPGASLLIASSPYAQRGMLWNMFQRHYGRDGSRTLVWRASTETMNPGIDPQLIAEAYEEDAAAAQAEYGAQFRDDVASFLPVEVVTSAVVPGRYEALPAAAQYVAFCDPSGGSGTDSFTLAIAHATPNGRASIDLIREWRPPLSPEHVVAQIAGDLARYGLHTVEGDRYAGLWPSDRFLAHGVLYEPSKLSASDIYLESLPLWMGRKIEMLDDKRAIQQLTALDRRAGRSGRDTISHAPGAHDDVANSVCGAALRAIGGRQNYDLLALVGRQGS